MQHRDAESSSNFILIKEQSSDLEMGFSSLQELFMSCVGLLLHTLLDICQEGGNTGPNTPMPPQKRVFQQGLFF